MDFEIALESFERWFKGYHLTSNDITTIICSIILCVLLIVLIVMLVYISIYTLFWTRIGWFFEDIWHWLKHSTPLAHYLCFGEEDLTDEDIHEMMEIIHQDNPPKYKIVRDDNLCKENSEEENKKNHAKESIDAGLCTDDGNAGRDGNELPL